jgi:hypothetical protein
MPILGFEVEFELLTAWQMGSQKNTLEKKA